MKLYRCAAKFVGHDNALFVVMVRATDIRDAFVCFAREFQNILPIADGPMTVEVVPCSEQ